MGIHKISFPIKHADTVGIPIIGNTNLHTWISFNELSKRLQIPLDGFWRLPIKRRIVIAMQADRFRKYAWEDQVPRSIHGIIANTEFGIANGFNIEGSHDMFIIHVL